MKNSLGYEIVAHVPVCDCGKPGTIVWQWDSYACLPCGKWLDLICDCGTGACEYAGRPETP